MFRPGRSARPARAGSVESGRARSPSWPFRAA